MHLVIATRTEPALPLSQLRARSQMTEIRPDDLYFTPAETAALLGLMLERPVDEATSAALAEKTEGWITGLRLAVLALRPQDDLDDLLASLPDHSHYVTEYLVSEVLSQLPEAIQDFLLKTSILDRFCGPLCDYVVALDEPECDGRANLEWLDEANLFTIPLDGRREWYRYHHQFQNLLRRRLERRCSADEIAVLHSRASVWLAQNGFIEEALRHALVAGDTETAVSLVSQHRHKLMNQDQWRLLDRWLRLFPDHIINQNPVLLISKAWVLYYFWYDLVGTIQVLDSLDDLLKNEIESSEVRRIAAEGLAIRSQFLYWYCDSKAVFSAVQQVLDNTPPAHECVITSAVISQGGAYQLLGDLDNAVQTLQRALQAATFKNTSASRRLLFALCAIYWSEGDLRNLQQTAELYLKLSQLDDISWSRSYALYYLGLVHYEKNELAEAERYLSQLIENVYLYPMQNVCHGAFPLALIYQAQGQPEKAEAVVQTVADLVQERQNSYFMTLVDVLRMELELRQGQSIAIAHWANQYKLGDLVALMRFYVPELTVIKALIAENTPTSLEKATKLLGQMQAHATSIHANSTLIRLLVLGTVAAEKQGSHSAALAHLEQAVRIGKWGGWKRPFLDTDPIIASTLTQLRPESGPQSRPQSRLQGTDVDYITQLLDDFPSDNRSKDAKPTIRHTESQSLIEPLTTRELEVLELLTQQMSNKEIAAHLVISAATVRNHTHNIYQKLLVKNRMQAVAKALELGLLPGDSL
jgi:LuxR family maltose regulon positive regulatory protein